MAARGRDAVANPAAYLEQTLDEGAKTTVKMLEDPMNFIGRGIGGGAAGIIGGRKVLEKLGLEQAGRKAEGMLALGKSQHEIAQKSAEFLSNKGNPSGAMSLFVGPDGQARVVLANDAAKLKRTPLVMVENGGVKLDIKEGDIIPISDIMEFPVLNKILDNPKDVTLNYNPFYDLFSYGNTLGVEIGGNRILSGSSLFPPNKLRNDPKGNFLEALLHEITHIIQNQGGTRTGASTSKGILNDALDEAYKLGSFKSSSALANIRNDIISASDDELFKIYRSNYGEAEARAGSEYSPYTFPMMYLGNTW